MYIANLSNYIANLTFDFIALYYLHKNMRGFL